MPTLLFSSGIPSNKVKSTDDIINKWLKERQDLVTEFFNLFQIHPLYSKEHQHADNSNLKTRLERFNDLLVDYVLLGHVKVFEKIYDAQKAYSDTIINDRNMLVQEILDTTNKVLEFEEKYNKLSENNAKTSAIAAPSAHKPAPTNTTAAFEQELKEDASKLMMLLENRFADEDKLIELYKEAARIEKIIENKFAGLVHKTEVKNKTDVTHKTDATNKPDVNRKHDTKPKPRT